MSSATLLHMPNENSENSCEGLAKELLDFKIMAPKDGIN